MQTMMQIRITEVDELMTQNAKMGKALQEAVQIVDELYARLQDAEDWAEMKYKKELEEEEPPWVSEENEEEIDASDAQGD